MTRREESEGQIPVTRKVTFESPSIAALVPGVAEIKRAWIQVGGAVVDEVLVGGEFEIWCEYIAENIGGIAWLTTVTVKGDGIQNYEDTKSKTSATVKLDNMGANVMPAGDSPLMLRLKLWLHDSAYQDPPYPPLAQW